MGLRYRSTFFSVDNVSWQIDIHDSAYSGAVNLFATGPDGFNLTYKGLTERLDPIMASSLSVPIVVTDATIEAFLNDTMTSLEERFSVKVYKNTALYWVGFLLVDLVQQEDIGYPYFCDLKFTDGLARLKDLDYNTLAGIYPYVHFEPFTGRDTIIAHLIKILTKTGIPSLYDTNDEFLNTVVNWFEIRHTYSSYNDPLAKTDLSHFLFYEYDQYGNITYSKCSDILIMILNTFNARILQANGIYHIIQPQEYARPYTYCRKYKKDGTFISSNSFYGLRMIGVIAFRKTGGVTKFFPALNRVTKVYKTKISTNSDGSVLPIKNIYNPEVPFITTVSGGVLIYFSGNIHQTFTAGTFYSGIFYSKWRMDIIVTNINTNAKLYLTNSGTSYIWSSNAADFITLQTPTYQGATWDKIQPVLITAPTLPSGEYSGTFKFALINHYNPDGSIHTFNSYLGDLWDYDCEEYTLIQDLPEDLATEDEIKLTGYSLNIVQSITANTLELKVPDTLIGDGPKVTHMGKLRSYNGTTWADTTLWGSHNNSNRKSINSLSVEENILGQRIPTKRFMGAFFKHQLTALSSFQWGSDVFVPLSISINPAYDEVAGEWFNVIIPVL